jgi:hypothetical protein
MFENWGGFDYCMGVEFLCCCSGQDHLMGFNSLKGYWLLVAVINVILIFVGLDFFVVEFVVLNMQQRIPKPTYFHCHGYKIHN